MTAPALVVVAPPGMEPRTARTVRAIAAQTRATRGDLKITLACLEDPAGESPGRRPTARGDFASVIDGLVRVGYDEIVLVPLLMGQTHVSRVMVPQAVAFAVSRHPGLRIRVTPVLGPEVCFLQALDHRLRDALQARRARELDALVLAAAGPEDRSASPSIHRLARAWGAHHRLPVIVAFAQCSPPATGEAVRSFRSQGRRHIAVGSLFLTPGRDLDDATELALEAGAVAVGASLGDDPEVSRVILARYAVGAVELVPV